MTDFSRLANSGMLCAGCSQRGEPGVSSTSLARWSDSSSNPHCHLMGKRGSQVEVKWFEHCREIVSGSHLWKSLSS